MCRLAVSVTVGFAIVLTAILAFTVIVELQRASRAQAAVDTIALANVLLDDLERERSEAIYLTASPAANTIDYATRTATTDETMRSLAASSLFTDASLSARQRSIVDHASAALGRLPALREPVTARTASSIDTARGYTAIHDALIEDMAALFDAFSGDPSSFPGRFEALAKLHDRVALETAVGYVAFAVDGMPSTLHTVFNEAIAAQSEYQTRYGEFSGRTAALALDALLERSAGLALYQARDALHAASSGLAPDPQHRVSWSQTMAPRVTDLAVERNRLARTELEQLVVDSRKRLFGAVLRAAIGVVVLLLALGAVRFVLTRRVGSSPRRTSAKGEPANARP